MDPSVILQQYQREVKDLDAQLLDAVTNGFTFRRSIHTIKHQMIADLQKKYISLYGEDKCVEANVM